MAYDASRARRLYYRLAPRPLSHIDLMVIMVPISGALSITLCRAKTGLPPSDTVIQRLIRGAIQTGLFASVFALCDLACFLWLPTTWLYLMFAIPIGRIYSNVSDRAPSLCPPCLTMQCDRHYSIHYSSVSVLERSCQAAHLREHQWYTYSLHLSICSHFSIG